MRGSAMTAVPPTTVLQPALVASRAVTAGTTRAVRRARGESLMANMLP
jgi:hypothetical protein